MLTPETAAKIDQGLIRLRDDQRAGRAPQPGAPGILRALAERAGVSQATILSLEAIAIARARAALLADPDLPPNLRRMAEKLLSTPNPTSKP